jgi:TPR repeat protein
VNTEGCKTVPPPKSPDAVTLLDKACSGGDDESCTKLAAFYFCGVGVAQRADKSIAHSTRACDLGSAKACANTAVLLMRGGPGVPPNPERAIALLEKACAAGNAPACGNLGGLLM